jgi:integrase
MQQTNTVSADRRGDYHYAVYQHRLVAADGQAYSRSFIVIKNHFGVIVRFTNLHDYAGVYAGKAFVPLQSDAKAKLHYVCKMLNYVLIERFPDFGADHVFDVTREMLEQFFRDYAGTPQTNGEYRSPASIERCIAAITAFYMSLCRKYAGQMKLKESELVTEKLVRGRRGAMVAKPVPAFQARGNRKTKSIFRELPTKAFEILMNNAFQYAPDIAFAMCLQAFAGLRAGEVCNVRQEQSPIGSGLSISMIGADVRKVQIDLTRELPMRSDGTVCGRIKKERVQNIYPPFLDAFAFAYRHHKQYLSKQDFEAGYCPMFVNGRGMAMTYADYANRFKSLVEKHFRPALLASGDPELRLYGQLLCEHNLGLHSLRHWFSVQLVLRGEDIAQVQYWRGDSSPESALIYLQNKGDLLKELELASDELIKILLSEDRQGDINELI